MSNKFKLLSLLKLFYELVLLNLVEDRLEVLFYIYCYYYLFTYLISLKFEFYS